MEGFDAEVGAAERVVATPRFGAAHAIGTWLFLWIAQWSIGYAVMSVWFSVAVVFGHDASTEQGMKALTANAAAPMLIAASAVTALLTFVAIRIFAWHLVHDRSANGLGLFVPARRQLLIWGAVGLAIGLLHVAAMIFIPAARLLGEMATLASQTISGRVAWLVVALLMPFPYEVIFRGFLLRGLMESWGVKVASVVMTALFLSGYAYDLAGNWPLLVAAFLLGIATLAARLSTGSVVAAFAVHQMYIVTLSIGHYATQNP